jgi:hypothetical protein
VSVLTGFWKGRMVLGFSLALFGLFSGVGFPLWSAEGFLRSEVEGSALPVSQVRSGGVILLRSPRVSLLPGRLEVTSHRARVEGGKVSYEITLRNPSRERVDLRADVRFFDDGYSQEYAKHPQIYDVVLEGGGQKVIAGQVDLSGLSFALRSVRLGISLMPARPPLAPPTLSALWARAKVVRVSAGAGDWINAGPLTVLIDPLTGLPTDRVSLPAPSGVVVPALHKNPWTGEIGLFLLVPVLGISSKAQYQQRGDKAVVLVPDAGHPGQVTQRQYQISGRREGRGVSRLVSVYEVVAFTSRDALCEVEGMEGLVAEQVGWADRGKPYTFVKAEGTRVGTPTAEPSVVRVGDSFKVRVPVSLGEGQAMEIQVTTEMGSPGRQGKTVTQSGVVEFSLQATQPGTVRVNVFPQEYQEAPPPEGYSTPGIQGIGDPTSCPGRPVTPPEGTTPVTRSDGGHGLRQLVPLVVAGALGTVLEIKKTRTERDEEVAIPVVTLGEEDSRAYADVMVLLQDVLVDGNTQDPKPCPERIKYCPCKHEWCGCPPKTLPCDQSYECSCTGTPHKEDCRCKLEGAPACGCPAKETTRCSVLYRGTAISAIYKPCGDCNPKCTVNMNPGCSTHWKTVQKAVSAATCAMAGAIAGSCVKPFLGSLIGAIGGAVVCALIDEWVTEEWCTNDGKGCANPGHSKCGCACSASKEQRVCNCGRKGCACKVGCGCGG